MTNTDWANKDFYKVLGVAKNAPAADIKKAYRKLARANHPDSHPGDKAAEDRFKGIAEAYDVVGDPKRRTEYDEMRTMFSAGGQGPFRGGGSGAGGPGTTSYDVGDLFGTAAGGAASPTSSGTSSDAGAPSVARVRRGGVPTWRPRRPSGSPRRSTGSRSR